MKHHKLNSLVPTPNSQETVIHSTIPTDLDEKYLLTIYPKYPENVLLHLTITDGVLQNLLIKEQQYTDIRNRTCKFNVSLYYGNGTLFAGHITSNRTVFLDDIYIFCGKIVTHKPLLERIEMIANILKQTSSNRQNDFNIQLTGYFLYNHLPLLLQKKQSCRIKFMPEHHSQKVYYFDLKFPKTIPITYAEQYMLVRKTKEFDVYITEDNSVLGVISIEMSQKLAEMFHDTNFMLIDCVYHPYFKCWVPENGSNFTIQFNEKY